MGLPGYFVDLLRRNPQVLVLAGDAGHAHIVCIDANGVIYDVVRAIETQEAQTYETTKMWPERLADMEPEAAARRLAPAVVAMLARLPGLVGATERLVVAFDGVAPAAKLAQQRQRRYARLMLGAAMQEVAGVGGGVAAPAPRAPRASFDTTQITPATPFMHALMPLVEQQLRIAAAIPVTFSGSDVPGEGEHKLMDLVRSGIWKDKHVMVHGLDADLIMLTLCNAHHCESLRLAREAPSFVKHIDESLSPSATYVIDIPQLARIIGKSMGGGPELAASDYVFLMSMLGNDFLPHQPAISIRDGGIERLCGAFAMMVAHDPEFRVLRERGDRLVPDWGQVQQLIGELAGGEDRVMAKLMKRRRGYASRSAVPGAVPLDNPEELEAIWNKLPAMLNGAENWIDAGSPGWRGRYYEHGLGEIVDDPKMPWSPWLEKAVEHWLAGLQWVWEYYTGPIPSWTWQYQGTHPPPLLHEVTRLGSFDDEKDKLAAWRGESEPVSNAVQLARVLPPKDAEGKWVFPEIGLRWEYCRHAWEAELMV